MRLARLREPFSHPDWIFEFKHDGFRALAYADDGTCRLVSRNGNTFASFASLAQSIANSIKHRPVLLDGEIVCLDENGRSQFNDLLFHRGEPCFFAFDLLWHGSEDQRSLPLIERKLRLQSLIPTQPSHLLYCDHIEERGEDLFRLACEHDLEGIVAKHKRSPYVSGEGRTSWIKIKNAHYTQIAGRDELFNRDDRRRHEQASDGWSGCVLACIEQDM
jgi:bifunctional non-homologous end joining protein LigD